MALWMTVFESKSLVLARFVNTYCMRNQRLVLHYVKLHFGPLVSHVLQFGLCLMLTPFSGRKRKTEKKAFLVTNFIIYDLTVHLKYVSKNI